MKVFEALGVSQNLEMSPGEQEPAQGSPKPQRQTKPEAKPTLREQPAKNSQPGLIRPNTKFGYVLNLCVRQRINCLLLKYDSNILVYPSYVQQEHWILRKMAVSKLLAKTQRRSRRYTKSHASSLFAAKIWACTTILFCFGRSTGPYDIFISQWLFWHDPSYLGPDQCLA